MRHGFRVRIGSCVGAQVAIAELQLMPKLGRAAEIPLDRKAFGIVWGPTWVEPWPFAHLSATERLFPGSQKLDSSSIQHVLARFLVYYVGKTVLVEE